MQSTTQKIYIGILIYNEAEETVIATGTDHNEVFAITEKAYNDLESTVFARFFVVDTTIQIPVETEKPTPEWYDKVLDIASTEMIAGHVLNNWCQSMLYENAVWSQQEYYKDPDNLMYDLENGFIISELEKDNGEYDPEFLELLAHEHNRNVEDYKDNDLLVILDALKIHF